MKKTSDRPRTKPITDPKKRRQPTGPNQNSQSQSPPDSTTSGRSPKPSLQIPEAAGQREAAGDSAAWRSSSTSHGYCKMSALGCVPYPAIFLPFFVLLLRSCLVKWLLGRIFPYLVVCYFVLVLEMLDQLRDNEIRYIIKQSNP